MSGVKHHRGQEKPLNSFFEPLGRRLVSSVFLWVGWPPFLGLLPTLNTLNRTQPEGPSLDVKMGDAYAFCLRTSRLSIRLFSV